jgi:hypothetical protein
VRKLCTDRVHALNDICNTISKCSGWVVLPFTSLIVQLSGDL